MERADDEESSAAATGATLPDPAPRQRRSVRGPDLTRFSVSLRTVTHSLDGAATLRQVDVVEPVRVPALRGQLRFCWRALNTHACASPMELASRERALWGGTGGGVAICSKVEFGGGICAVACTSHQDRLSAKAPSPMLERWVVLHASCRRSIGMAHCIRERGSCLEHLGRPRGAHTPLAGKSDADLSAVLPRTVVDGSVNHLVAGIGTPGPQSRLALSSQSFLLLKGRHVLSGSA